MQVRLCEARVGEPGALDVTVKSATGWARAFAPSWDMVWAVKRDPANQPWYRYHYDRILDQVPLDTWRALYRQGRAQGGALKLACYCRHGAFCHRQLLIRFATAHPELARGFTR
jgi:hypothetical protein